MKYLIVGNSAAGVTAAEKLREIDAAAAITIVDREEHPFYSRVLTSYLLAGDIQRQQVFLRSPFDYASRKIKTYFGRKAVKLLAGQKKLELDDGTLLTYDKLLLATGAGAKLPDLPGKELKGVFTLRNLADAEGMAAFLKKGGRAVVAGGGLVSLKASEAFLKLGLKVTMVVSSNELLSRVLNARAAAMVRRRLEQRGAEVLLRENVAAIAGKETVEEVTLESGGKIACGLVLFGKGVEPNIGLAAGTAISTDGGILVDKRLATTESDIYAAGDAALAPDMLEGGHSTRALWSTAVEQGRFAARSMAGKQVVYPGALARNSFVFAGLGVMSGGRSRPGADQLQEESMTDGVYRQVVLEGGRLVGTTIAGSTKGTAGWFGNLGQEVSPEATDAFLTGKYHCAARRKKFSIKAGI